MSMKSNSENCQTVPLSERSMMGSLSADMHKVMHASMHTNAPAYVHTFSKFTTNHKYKATENNSEANYEL